MTKIERIRHNQSQIFMAYVHLGLEIGNQAYATDGSIECDGMMVWVDSLIQSALKRYEKSNDFNHELTVLKKIRDEHIQEH